MSEQSNTTGIRETHGVISELKALLGSILEHCLGLLHLLSWEAREAGVHYLRLVILLLVALFLLLIGYLFSVLFIIFLFAWWFSVKWMWVMLALALLHGAGALVGLWMLARGIRKPLFVSTIAEIKKEIEGLRSPSQQTPYQ